MKEVGIMTWFTYNNYGTVLQAYALSKKLENMQVIPEISNYRPKIRKTNIYNMTPTDIHYYVADWALSGNKLNEIGDCLWYLNPFRPDCSSTFPSNGSGTFHTRFGNHCFYRPTDKYKDT